MRMLKIISLLVLLVVNIPVFSQHVKYVNPFIGTNSMGHTFPGAVVPFGLIALSPDTDTIPHNLNGIYQKDSYKYCAGYQYSDNSIVGFSHTHFSGTGHSDLGDLLIMPTNGALKLNPGTSSNTASGYRSEFSHTDEKATPGYYSVLLKKYGIRAELTTTERVGVHRYSYPNKKVENRIIFDLVHGIYNYDGKVLWASIRVENPYLITGYRITNGWARENYQYFAIELSQPISSYGYKESDKIKYGGGWKRFKLYENFPEMAGRKITAYFNFENIDTLIVKVAFSAVSTKGAILNLNLETKGKSFEQIKTEAEQKWENKLSTIEIDGSDNQKQMFYTSLYHTMINPSIYQDVDSLYRGLDGNIHKAVNFKNYTIFSLWDTYRALHPLFNVINRDVNRDIIMSMYEHYSQSVHKILPVWSHMANENWCMIGYHSTSVIADAVTKKIEIPKGDFVRAAISSSNARWYDNIGDYLRYGYVPFDKNKSGSSITLEYAYDDWTIYQLAKSAGKENVADVYKERSLSYRRVFDKDGFAKPRMSNGNWKPDFSALNTHNEGFIEGNSWNYSFYVPHDVKGLISIMGGEKSFIKRLDSLFTMDLPDHYFEHTEDVTKEGIMGNYVHGNEPSHHIPYLYAWTSQPWKTQLRIRNILDQKYKNEIDGLCGNDDCGQMSAWYIFSSLGFYPVCPGSEQLVLGAPYFSSAKIKLENEKYFEIKTKNFSPNNKFVKKVKLNGKEYTKAYILNSDILNGGILEFEMSPIPNKRRQFNDEEKPYSLTDELVSRQEILLNEIEVKFEDSNSEGHKKYLQITSSPESYIRTNIKRVLDLLYFDNDSIPPVKKINYSLGSYNGVSSKDGNAPEVWIKYNTGWIEKMIKESKSDKEILYETTGVLIHELVHVYQYEPKGIGNYSTNKTFRAFIEGVADAIRIKAGYIDYNLRPLTGDILDGYKTTGFFLVWINDKYDKDFIKKFNRTALKFDEWSFDKAIQSILGPNYTLDKLWKEYKETFKNK